MTRSRYNSQPCSCFRPAETGLLSPFSSQSRKRPEPIRQTPLRRSGKSGLGSKNSKRALSASPLPRAINPAILSLAEEPGQRSAKIVKSGKNSKTTETSRRECPPNQKNRLISQQDKAQ